MLWKKGFIRLLLVAGMVWMLLILSVLLVHIWSCQSSVAFFSVMCNREGKVFFMLDSMRFIPRPPHRCSIPVADDPDAIVIPKQRTTDTIVQNLTYIVEDEETDNLPHSSPSFGGNISWTEREESFKLKPEMKDGDGFIQAHIGLNLVWVYRLYLSEPGKFTGSPPCLFPKVHCGFVHNSGGDMDPKDIKYAKKCRFVVASGIFDGYHIPDQPSNISTPLWGSVRPSANSTRNQVLA